MISSQLLKHLPKDHLQQHKHVKLLAVTSQYIPIQGSERCSETGTQTLLV